VMCNEGEERLRKFRFEFSSEKRIGQKVARG